MSINAATTASRGKAGMICLSVECFALKPDALSASGFVFMAMSHVLAPYVEAIHSCEFMMKTGTAVPTGTR